MKRTILFIFSLVALIGILNCVLIEPAFAYQDQAAHPEYNEDSDCCFIHCATCHQWVPSTPLTVTHNVQPLDVSIPESPSFHPDSPVGAIFHPPIAR